MAARKKCSVSDSVRYFQRVLPLMGFEVSGIGICNWYTSDLLMPLQEYLDYLEKHAGGVGLINILCKRESGHADDALLV